MDLDEESSSTVSSKDGSDGEDGQSGDIGIEYSGPLVISRRWEG